MAATRAEGPLSAGLGATNEHPQILSFGPSLFACVLLFSGHRQLLVAFAAPVVRLVSLFHQ